MLRLVNIDKTYKAASGNVEALKKVNLSFRKNEFVSILGPSGSGKTTLLNIIGGLDKYTSGDLIIAGKSTKDFKDRDWDFYRNQRIGFIFQSYNLIPHQNVLSNVELALTISGISKTERVARAKEALDKVGLTDQYYKKPNQLSGGQCQRVAIARALVNNPEILLADEPTGALDTKTSEQIMNLIKEISKDRLVIMVTHNPDLAERYSTRIINLLDGEIVHDSNPFKEADEIKEVSKLNEETVDKTSKAKMGLWTANKLSFKNLLSKKGRTILVSIASSIGIIGVSTVLAVSFGVTSYVNDMQDDMLSSYPIEIAEKSVDLTSLMSGLTSQEKKKLAEFDVNTQVGMDSMIEYLMDKYSDLTKVTTNDINQTLVNYVDELSTSPDVAAIQYNYGIDVTNNIYGQWKSSSVAGEEEENQWVTLNGLTQRYIEELKTVEGFSSFAAYVNLFTNFMHEMPGDEGYITGQYDMLGNSKFANNENEIMLVVNKDSTLTDLLLGQMGIYSHDEFINIGKKAVEIYKKGDPEKPEEWGLKQKLQEHVIDQATYDAELAKLTEKYPYRQIFNYDELIGKTFYYMPHSELWEYSQVSDDTKMEGNILLYKTDKIYNLRYSYVSALGMTVDLLQGDEINLVTPSESKKVTFVRSPASTSRDPNTFFDGFWGQIESIYSPTEMIGYLSVNSAAKTCTVLDKTFAPVDVFVDGVGDARVVMEAEETDILEAFNYQVNNPDVVTNPKAMKMTISGILRAKESTNFGSLSRGVYYTKALTNRYMTDASSDDSLIYTDPVHGLKTHFMSGQALVNTYQAYCKYSYVDYTDSDAPVLKNTGYAFAINGDLSSSISSLFAGAFGGSDALDTNKTYLRSLTGQSVSINEDAESILDFAKFSKLPQEMAIYPKDFESKDNITEYLDRWNSDETLTIKGETVEAKDRKELSYTDTVAMIISVINSLITIVTAALVSFTSLSLVVSCFMIAVITYISVMERVKEIGVIRSLGGRKRDVNRLFTAENFMTGLVSGVIGIVVTYILSAIINLVVHFFGVPAIAALPWWMALIMVGLSIFLNVISGFLPSRKAAKQDPVVALRSE